MQRAPNAHVCAVGCGMSSKGHKGTKGYQRNLAIGAGGMEHTVGNVVAFVVYALQDHQYILLFSLCPLSIPVQSADDS